MTEKKQHKIFNYGFQFGKIKDIISYYFYS